MKNTMMKAITALTLAAAMMTGTAMAGSVQACEPAYTYAYGSYIVTGTDYYLALRTEAAYKAENEIGKLTNGQIVTVIDKNTYNAEYWYVYAPTLGRYGYVNHNYLR